MRRTFSWILLGVIAMAFAAVYGEQAAIAILSLVACYRLWVWQRKRAGCCSNCGGEWRILWGPVAEPGRERYRLQCRWCGDHAWLNITVLVKEHELP